MIKAFFLRQGLNMALAVLGLSRPGWFQTQRPASLCLPNPMVEGTGHYDQLKIQNLLWIILT